MFKKKSSPAVFINTMLMAYLGAALALASGEVAAIENIDRAWTGTMHPPAGPFGTMDSVGLDTCWKINAYWAEKTGQKNAEECRYHKKLCG